MLLFSHTHHPFISVKNRSFRRHASHGLRWLASPIYIWPHFGVYPSPFVQKHACACMHMRWCVFEHVGGCLWVWTDGSDGDQEQVCSCGCSWETGMILASRLHLRIPGDKPTLGLPSDHLCSYCRWFQGCSWSASMVVIFTDNKTVHDWEKISFSWRSVPQKELFLEFFLILLLCFSTENMVKGLDEDESSFLDEVSRKQSLIEKHRRDEEAKEIKEYRISFCTLKHIQYYCHALLKKIAFCLSLSLCSPSLSWC